jgi:cell division protein FtsZ
MNELGRHVRDHTQIIFGTAVDGRMGNRLSVTIISSLGTEDSLPAPSIPTMPESFLAPPPPILEEPTELPPPQPKMEVVPGPEMTEAEPPAVDLIPFEQPAAPIDAPAVPVPAPSIKKIAPRLIPPKKKPLLEKEATPAQEKHAHAKQEVLQFEPVTRGRFEKSEPTIVEGQDLDVPTFLRKNIRVK